MALFLVSRGRSGVSKILPTISRLQRNIQSTMANPKRNGLVLGVYEADDEGQMALTSAAQGFQNTRAARLSELINMSGLKEKKGSSRVFYGLDDHYSSVGIVSLGKQGLGYDQQEEIDQRRENIRGAIAAGVMLLQDAGVSHVDIDPCGDPEAAAEGAVLGAYSFDELKTEEKRKTKLEMSCYSDHCENTDSVQSSWQQGVILAEGQNLSRRLMEMPANRMTPTKFAESAVEMLSPLPNVQVNVRNQDWVESQKMGAFLSVARGSEEELKFVEVIYSGGEPDAPPQVIVGKGITFDSGGISIKPSMKMDAMKADMGGAACALASVYTAARLRIPINIVMLTPLCENMPSGRATKPGDVVTAMNGKTVQVDNTDCEGRLILCDTLCYAETFKPRSIIDMATLTGAMIVALGSAATGVFTNSTQLWETMYQAGIQSGDRVWRMPVFKHYTKQVTESTIADINNLPSSRAAGACTAAAFLKEFVTNDQWMHLDIAGVMSNGGEIAYMRKGMAGRPTRTIVGFLQRMSQQ